MIPETFSMSRSRSRTPSPPAAQARELQASPSEREASPGAALWESGATSEWKLMEANAS